MNNVSGFNFTIAQILFIWIVHWNVYKTRSVSLHSTPFDLILLILCTVAAVPSARSQIKCSWFIFRIHFVEIDSGLLFDKIPYCHFNQVFCWACEKNDNKCIWHENEYLALNESVACMHWMRQHVYQWMLEIIADEILPMNCDIRIHWSIVYCLESGRDREYCNVQCALNNAFHFISNQNAFCCHYR